MVAEPVQIDYGAAAAERMSALVRSGMRPVDAAAAVAAEMLKDGSAWELFVQHGDSLVYDTWRRNGGPAAVTPIRKPQLNPSHKLTANQQLLATDSNDGIDSFIAGDIDSVDSIYQAPLKVDGEWTTLGSLSRPQCRAMQFFFEGRVQQAQHLAQFFKRLADGLSDKQTVRKHWSEMQLRTIYAELGT